MGRKLDYKVDFTKDFISSMKDITEIEITVQVSDSLR